MLAKNIVVPTASVKSKISFVPMLIRLRVAAFYTNVEFCHNSFLLLNRRRFVSILVKKSKKAVFYYILQAFYRFDDSMFDAVRVLASVLR